MENVFILGNTGGHIGFRPIRDLDDLKNAKTYKQLLEEKEAAENREKA